MDLDPHLGLTPLVGPLDDDHRARLAARGVAVVTIGHSGGGRPLHGLLAGSGRDLVSVVAGAHPDEPAGPIAACHLAAGWAAAVPDCRLAVVPLLDVDGVVEQAGWLSPWSGAVDIDRWLAHRHRRQPGADREFAWPGAPWPGTVLPECRAAAAFFDHQGPARAHLSLHGMACAAGAWFLLDEAAILRPRLWLALRRVAASNGFALHDVPRHGDKGFRRAGPGFCTTPSGAAMRLSFLARGDRATAAGFAWSSMESARARAHRAGAPAPLCAVSEFPLVDLPATRGVPVAAVRSVAANALAAGNGRPVALVDQVRGMLGMTCAVAAEALSRAS